MIVAKGLIHRFRRSELSRQRCLKSLPLRITTLKVLSALGLDNWARKDDGEWVVADPSRQQCRYTQHYLSDIVLGLYCCGRAEFRDIATDCVDNWSSIDGARVIK